MAAIINTNTYSLNAQRNVSKNSLGLSSALERLSSGLRINSAKDDAAGLAISLNQDAFARSITSRIRASSDTISQNQIADGALQTLGDITLRAGELQSQLDNGTKTLNDAQKGYITSELASLKSTADDVISNAKFNGNPTIDAKVVIDFTDAGTIQTSLDNIATARAAAGANVNSANFAIQADQAAFENQLAAKSRITDADFAEETSKLSRFQVLQQAGFAIISQANAIPQQALTLLR